MAHELTHDRSIMIGQALHGYADGHRQIAVSVDLRPKDAKTVLALSDISGPGVRIDEPGYLTGYPLPESGVYALARTWGAPEMPRPGCVWTHTLFIDFAELAQMDDFGGLLALFHRPSREIFSKNTYGCQLNLTGFEPLDRWKGKDASWVKNILAGLYRKPRSRIISNRTKGGDVDRAVLSIWSQQWPRLRRQFRFCTFAASDRSTDGCAFDLQLLPDGSHGIRSRFTKVVEVDSKLVSDEQWLDDAVGDLLSPDRLGLRTFLRRSGADVAMGREAFSPLCRLHRLVRAIPNEPSSLLKAIEIVRGELPPKLARTAGGVVARATLEGLDNLDDDALDFLLSNLDLIEADKIYERTERIGRKAWLRDPAILVDGTSDGLLAAIVRRTLETLGTDEVVGGIAKVPAIRDVVLAARPDVTSDPSFWLLDPRPASDVLGRQGIPPDTAYALIAAGRQDLVSEAVAYLGSDVVLAAVAKLWGRDDKAINIEGWLSYAAKDGSAVAQILIRDHLPWSFLVALSRVTTPDTVPNDFGIDPWVTAHNNSSKSLSDESSDLILYSYLLARAFGYRSRNSAELAQIGFEKVYSAAAYNRLPEEGWRFLDPKLPWSVIWYWWDRCQRLRSAVVDLFVDRDLSTEIFLSLTPDIYLVEKLTDAAADKGGKGRSYAKRLKRAIKEMP